MSAIVWKCLACDKIWESEQGTVTKACPHCGSHQIDVIGK